jgi:hypothetical protein
MGSIPIAAAHIGPVPNGSSAIQKCTLSSALFRKVEAPLALE